MILGLKIFIGVLSGYLLLILIRVMLTWFQGVDYGKAYRILAAATDPYLRIFQKIKFLRFSAIDFSPVAAMLVIVVLIDFASQFIREGRLSLGIVLAVITSALWSVVSFLLSLFIILTAIRFFMGLSGANSVGPFARTVDLLIAPILEKTRRLFFRKRFVTYKTILATTGASLLVLYIAGKVLFGLLYNVLQALPV
ncbi:YggT family protein [Sediminispirochaeta bajacaliforniensis]|uniref:YggT family protein n=1 Tax=Sediminispirochaeta bajacaliforniensis TaxID=148 RepID=UPI000364258E|nr:YggT family protein [Sediminispirochaeta bajacaliforniensis]